MSTNLISLLLEKPGEFFSGEELSNHLNISRTAVWKQVNALKDKGFKVEAVPRKGYKLICLPDKLYPQLFSQKLKTKLLKGPYYHFEQVDSTNKRLRALAEECSPEGTIVVAEKQLQGRGRLGRKWHSSGGKGIWLSILLKPNLLPEQSFCLTLLAGVAVQQTIQELSGLEAKIKWPNDILFQEKKICGILTEIKAEIDALHYLLLGIGINVNQEKGDFPPQLTEANSLKAITGIKQDRNMLLNRLLQNLDTLYGLLLQKGFAPVKKMWEKNNTTLSRQILVQQGNSKFFARALEIDERGCLIVKNSKGEIKTLTAGEVSLVNKMPLEEGKYDNS